MAKAKKSEKYNTIIQLMLQDVPTEEIAKKTGYSVGYLHNIFEELRGEYGVNSKVGIATSYLADKLIMISNQINDVILMTGGCKITCIEKSRTELKFMPKKRKK